MAPPYIVRMYEITMNKYKQKRSRKLKVSVKAPQRDHIPVKTVSTFLFTWPMNQDKLVYRPFQHLSGTGSSNKQTDFTNQAIVAGQNFCNFCKWPLVSGACIVMDQDNITNLTVRAGFVPFLAFLLQHAILSLPATPKLI